jgi:hypothetical protein
MKRTDFFVGIVDFFAALLPGGLATWLVLQYVDPSDLRRWYRPLEGASDVGRAVAFFFASYVLGHFVFFIGAKVLDDWYDRWRARVHPNDAHPTYCAADALRKELSKGIGDSGAPGAMSTLKWARAYATIHAPETRAEIDGFEANSKFFRSLVVLFALATVHFLLREQRLDLAVGSGLLCALSLWRFYDQRWKLSELTFATAVIIHETKTGRASAPDGALVGDGRPPSFAPLA